MEFYCRGTSLFYRNGRRALVVLFSGCNYNCRYCYNAQLLSFKKSNLIDTKEILRVIRDNPDRYVLLAGGEPCIQKLAVQEIAQGSMKFGKKCMLMTNGSRPDTLSLLSSLHLIDTVIIDLKAPVTHYEKFTRSETFFKSSQAIFNDVRKSLDVLKKMEDKVIVKTTIVPHLLYRKEHLLQIAAIVDEYGYRWELHQFIPGKTLDKKFANIIPPSPSFLEHLKTVCQKAYPQLRIDVVVSTKSPK